MQAVVALPSPTSPGDLAVWRETISRRVAGVPLLVRVLATAARSGVRSVLVVHPPEVAADWLREHLRSPLLSAVSVQLVCADREFDPAVAGDWQRIAGQLDQKFLWLPWNVVTLKKTLAALVAAGESDGRGVRSSPPEASGSAPPSAGALSGALSEQAVPALIVTRTLVGDHHGGLPAYLGDPHLPRLASPDGPGIAVNSDETARAAERMLVGGAGKASDGIYSTFNRRLCRPSVRWLLRTPVSANMVSIAGIPVVALAGYWYAQGNWMASIAGSLTYFVSVLLDEIDGMLARTKFSESPFGTWLDTMSDYLGYLILWVGMSVGLWRQHHDTVWLRLGGLTLVVSVLVMVVLIKQRQRASTPNAFHDQFMERLEGDSANVISRVIRLFSFLPKKAVFSHYVIWFTVLGLLPLFVSLAAFGSVVTLAFVLYSNRFFRVPGRASS